MKEQQKKSSSIIVALTDGKLEPYIHQLTKDEVSCCLTLYIIYTFMATNNYIVMTYAVFIG